MPKLELIDISVYKDVLIDTEKLDELKEKIALILDTTADNIYIELDVYIDGVLEATIASNIVASYNAVNIGYNFGTAVQDFKGTLDEVAIFNTALTQQNVTDLYQAAITSGAITIDGGLVASTAQVDSFAHMKLTAVVELIASTAVGKCNGCQRYCYSHVNSNTRGSQWCEGENLCGYC